MELRIAQPADVEAIAELARSEIERGLGWTWNPARVARALRDRETMGVVADEGGEVQGFCIVQYGRVEAHLLLIGVSRNRRRDGLGTQLLDWQIDCMRVAGIVEVVLELRAGNAVARKFYERHGFHLVRRVRRYYQGREDALRMCLKLSAEPEV